MTESNIIERLRSCVCETGAYSAVINDAIDAITGLHQQLHTAQAAAQRAREALKERKRDPDEAFDGGRLG